MSFDDYWDALWAGPTQAEVDQECNAVTAGDLAEARAAHPSWSKDLSDVAVRALLVIEAVGKRRG